MKPVLPNVDANDYCNLSSVGPTLTGAQYQFKCFLERSSHMSWTIRCGFTTLVILHLIHVYWKTVVPDNRDSLQA